MPNTFIGTLADPIIEWRDTILLCILGARRQFERNAKGLTITLCV